MGIHAGRLLLQGRLSVVQVVQTVQTKHLKPSWSGQVLMEKAAFIASAGITSVWLPPPSDSVSPQVPSASAFTESHCLEAQPRRITYQAVQGDTRTKQH